VGRRPQPGAAGWRAARRRPAEHDSAAHLDDAHVVRGSATTTATVAATTLMAPVAAAVAVAAAISSYGGDRVGEQHCRSDQCSRQHSHQPHCPCPRHLLPQR